MDPLALFLTEHFFDSWGQLLRCTRNIQRNDAVLALRRAPANERFSAFQALAGHLSGSECAYLIWTFNLMSYDPSRTVGEEVSQPPSLTHRATSSTAEAAT